MAIESAYSSALTGIRRGLDGLDRNAAEIARATAGREPASVTGPLVESQSHARQVESSVRVIEATDAALGALLDEFA